MFTGSLRSFQHSLTKDHIVLGGTASPAVRILVGIWLAWVIFLGGWIASMFLGSGPRDGTGVPPEASGIFLMIALVFLAMTAGGWALVFWVDRLTLDITARTYVWERGAAPFIRRRSGSLDNFGSLHLSRQSRTNAGGRSYSFYVLRLTCKKGSQKGSPMFYFMDGNPVEVATALSRLSERTGLSIQEEAD